MEIKLYQLLNVLDPQEREIFINDEKFFLHEKFYCRKLEDGTFEKLSNTETFKVIQTIESVTEIRDGLEIEITVVECYHE